MEEMKQEFEAYLKQLVTSYRETDNTIESSLPAHHAAGRFKNFNADAERKMYELISRNRNESAMAAKLELTSLKVKYNKMLLEEVL